MTNNLFMRLKMCYFLSGFCFAFKDFDISFFFINFVLIVKIAKQNLRYCGTSQFNVYMVVDQPILMKIVQIPLLFYVLSVFVIRFLFYLSNIMFAFDHFDNSTNNCLQSNLNRQNIYCFTDGNRLIELILLLASI